MIFITCALHCEAKTIIEKYRLVVDREACFPVFTRDDITLVVTGVGKMLMASAMNYVYARFDEPDNAAWLNVGIAGKKNAALGEIFNINKVTENSSGTNWYPARLPELDKTKTCSLITVDKPENNYAQTPAYDMEASAFMQAALRFSSIELLQILKIVSDNEDNDLVNIDKKLVSLLIEKSFPNIEEIISVLVSHSIEMNIRYWEQDIYEQCLEKWHFSEYQKKSLVRLLQQWKVLDNDANIQSISDSKNSKQVISILTKIITDSKIMFE